MKNVLLLAVAAMLVCGCQYIGRGVSTASPDQAFNSVLDSPAAASTLDPTVAPPTEGCGPSEPVLIKNTGGSSPARGRPPFPPIRPETGPGSSLEKQSTVDGVRTRGFPAIVPMTDVPLQLLVASAVDADSKPTDVRLYYSRFDIPQSMQLPDFYKAGGFAIEEQFVGVLNFDELVAEVGDFGTVVAVGPYQALVALGDPLFEGSVRTYNIVWADGVRDMSLAAPFDKPAQVVDLARAIYCTT